MLPRSKVRGRRCLALVSAGVSAVLGTLASGPVRPAIAADAAPALTRISGSDRFATAELVAETAFPHGANTAVVASASSFPDALTGAYLAGTFSGGAPVLLVGAKLPVPAPTLAALRTLDAHKVVIIGGSASVSDAVAGALAATPIGGTPPARSATGSGALDLAVSRLYGSTRYGTMERVDEAGGPAGLSGGHNTAVLVTGDGFADAMGAAPLAYARHFPMVLTDGSAGALGPEALSVLRADSIGKVIVVGGAAAISPAIVTQLRNLGITLDTSATHGDTRSDTSVALADDEMANYGFSSARFDLARGDDFADSLTAGPLGGSELAPTLVANGPSAAGAVPGFLAAHAVTERAGNLLGGPGALTPSLVQSLGLSATTTTTTAPTTTTTTTTTTAPTTTTTTTVPLPVPVVSGSPYSSGTTGKDISWPQCGGTVPAAGAFGVVGVNDGHAFSTSPCLVSEAAWGGGGLSVYLNLNSPSESSRYMSGPAGNCSSTDASCQAYNYGANAVTYSLGAASAAGVAPRVWWLDVETGNTWSSSTADNDQVVRGALAELAAHKDVAGIYSTSYQWSVIAGAWTPDVPQWVPSGASSAAGAAQSCGGSYFTSGATWLVQYSAGNFDGDVAC